MTDEVDENVEKVKIALEKLDVQENGIVIIRFPDDTNPAYIETVGQQIQQQSGTFPSNLTILCLHESVTIESLDEYQMNELGWFKFTPNRMN